MGEQGSGDRRSPPGSVARTDGGDRERADAGDGLDGAGAGGGVPDFRAAREHVLVELVRLVAALREAGVTVPATGLLDAARALSVVGLGDERRVAAALRTTLVAESATEYATALRDRYEFELSGLSDAEREVIEGALNDTNYIENDGNDGFASLVDRFRDHESVVQNDHYGYYVVSYEGRLYWAEMDYGSYADDGDSSTPPEATPPPEA